MIITLSFLNYHGSSKVILIFKKLHTKLITSIKFWDYSRNKYYLLLIIICQMTILYKRELRNAVGMLLFQWYSLVWRHWHEYIMLTFYRSCEQILQVWGHKMILTTLVYIKLKRSSSHNGPIALRPCPYKLWQHFTANIIVVFQDRKIWTPKPLMFTASNNSHENIQYIVC